MRDGKLAIEISGVVYGEIVEALLQEVADGLLIGMKMKTHLAARYGAEQTPQVFEGVVERHAMVERVVVGQVGALREVLQGGGQFAPELGNHG